MANGDVPTRSRSVLYSGPQHQSNMPYRLEANYSWINSWSIHQAFFLPDFSPA
jgi:hypothetical protein